MKAKFITFVRGLMNGTPPRFQSYLKSLTILLGLVLSMNVWGADPVATATATDGKTYVVAAYNGSKYFALPQITNAATYSGTEIAVNTSGYVTTKDAPTWTLEEGTTKGQFYLKYENGSTYYLYKNGTSTSNYNIKGSSSDKNYWSFTKSGNYYNVIAVGRQSNHTYLNYYSSKFQVRGTSASTSNNNNTNIILLELAPSYKITATSNNTNYGTVELSGDVITASPKSGYTYANPAYTVTSGSAEVEQDGDKFTVKTTADCTVRINFAVKQAATIKLSEAGVITDGPSGKYSGESYTLPTTCKQPCGDKTFVGWSTETVDSPTKPTSKFYEPGEEVTLAAENIFYAVFADATSGGTSTVDLVANDGTFSTDHITYTALNGKLTLTQIKATSSTNVNSSYAKKGTDSNRPRVYQYQTIKIEGNSGLTFSSVSITHNGEKYGNGLTANTSINTNGSVTDNTTNVTKATSTTSGGTQTFTLKESGSELYIQNAGSTSVQWHLAKVNVTYTATSYSNYSTTCCTPLAKPTNVVATETKVDEITFGWDEVPEATGYEYQVDNGTWQTATGRTATVSDLTAGQTIVVKVRATYDGAADYCAAGEESEVTNLTTLYTITAESNDQAWGMAMISTEGGDEATSIACVAGTKIYLHAYPGDNYEFNKWSTNSGTITDNEYITDWTTNTTVTATFIPKTKVLESISITTPPSKKTYLQGESFEPTGMVVEAKYVGIDETTVITDYTYSPTTALQPGDIITISYTEGDVTKTTTYEDITVTPVYTVNWYVNGTAVKTLEKVAKGTTYASLEKPDTPADDALSTCEANKFMGWATALITKDDATEADFNAIKLNEATATISNTCKEFHAVFAKGQESAPAWSKITSTSQITEGTYAIISYDEAYYLKNAQSSSAPDVTAIQKENNKIKVLDDMKWLLAISGNNYILESASTRGIYLWGADTNEGIRILTTSDKQNKFNTWVLESSTEYGLRLKSSSYTRYLSTYKAQDWRNYGSTTSENRAANLYKLSGGTSYSNFITTCKDVKSIEVQTAPDKVDYTEEETLDLTGLVVRVTYDDDSYLDITSGFTTDPANGAMLTNETKVTITYKEKTCDQAITITPLPRKTINATAPEGGTYTVKVGDGEAQTISAATTITDVIAGRIITMTSTADDQHQLPSSDPFVVKNESDADVTVSKKGDNYSFTMPNSNVTITARYVQTYTITSATGLVGGTVATDKTKTSKGSTVNVTVTPNPGYSIVRVYYVKDGESAETLINDGSFSMPASNVTVSAEFEAIKYTITLNDKGNITLKENLLYNDNVNLPALTPCYGYAFEGWTETAPTGDTWATKPAIVAQLTVTADVTFYAVYSQSSGDPIPTNDYQQITSSDELTSGAQYMIVHYNTDSKYYAMEDDDWAIASYHEIPTEEVSPSNNIISNPQNSYLFQITIDGTKYSIQGLSSGNYITLNSADYLYMESTKSAPWIITFDNNKAVINAKVGSNNHYLHATYDYGIYFEENGNNKGTNYLYKQVIVSNTIYTAQPDCKTLDEIVIMQEPTKTIYKKDETFDKTDMIVYAAFTDGSDADVTAYIEVDETTPLTMTDDKVTVSYTQDGVTATADQNIYVVDLASIAVKSGKDAYTVGKSFDLSKLVLTATYKNTAETKSVDEEVTSGFTVSPSGALQLTDDKVTITYNGKTVDYPITVTDTKPFTVIFAASNTSEYTETEASKSAGVKVPSVTACPDYTFVGWTAEEIDGTTATQPELITITQGRYYPTEDVILYPVFRGLSNPGVFRRATSLDDITDGTKVVMYSEGGHKTIAIGTSNFYGGTLPAESDNQITCYDDNMIWTVSGTTSSCQFTNGTKTIGVETLPSSNSTSLSNTTSNSQWKIRMNDTHFIIYQPYSDNTNSAYVEYYSNSWLAFKTGNTPSAASYGYLNTRIYVPAGNMIYTSTPATCDVAIEQNLVLLNAGSGSVDKEEYILLKDESMTLPTPTFSITDWSFYGWSETELKREDVTAPELVANSFTPTEDVILNAIYRRSVDNGYVYKTYPSTLQRPSFSPEIGTYDEAKDVSITAGEGATIYYRKATDQMHHVMNEDYDATVDEAAMYSSAIKTSTTTYIVAVAKYSNGYSDEEMYKIDFNYPDAPTFSVETESDIFKGGSVTITAPDGTLLRYKINTADVVELATNTYTHTFNTVVDNITITAYSEKSGLKSEEVSATYHIKPVPNKVTFHAGTGLIDGERTKEIYEDAADEGLILPILDAPCTNGDSWKFYGWAKATVDTTTSTPTILKEGDSDCSYTAQGLRFYPASDCELYAVYTKTTGIVELINEDFASAMEGSVTNPSGTVWSGDKNFASEGIAYAYEAGKTIKLSSSSNTGYITTNALNVPIGSTLNISLDYRSYGNTPEKANVKISETNGTAEQTIAGEATDGFVTKSTTLTTTVANPTIEFAATINDNKIRCYIDNVVITMGTPVQNYATNPECCVHTISFNTDGGEAIEPIAIPCGTGNFVSLPEAQKQNCSFIKWTLNSTDYEVGDIYEYAYNRTDDVEFTAVFSDPITSVTVQKDEIKYASELPYNYNGDLYVKDGGIFVADIALTVNNFVIEVGQGHAGQVKAATNLTIHGDAYMQLEVDPNDVASPGWYAFAVPFPVDALNGVYYNETKLTNEVGYAIMDYHGDVRAQGQYGWKKYRGILQPGVFYYLTVGDTDYKNLRFHLKKDGDYTIENAASKWENDRLKSEKCRTDFYPYINSGDGQETDRGYNGVANKALEDVTINTNTSSMSNWVYTYNNQFKVFSTEDISESPVFSPATPFFVVSTANEEKSFSANFQPLPAANEAPRFAPMVQAFSKVKVTLSNNAYTDKYYVSASEDAKNEYELGLDAVKMGTIDNNTKVPQIVSVNYNNTLLSAEYAQLVNGQATISLLLYAPADGEYTIAATECKDGTIYLTQNGVDIWNLKDAYTLTLNKGKAFEYGLHLVVDSGQAPTNINSLNGNNKAQKIFKDQNIYILHDTKLYNAQGIKVQ